MQGRDRLMLGESLVGGLQDQPSRGTRGIECLVAGKGGSNEGHRQDLGSHRHFQSTSRLISMETPSANEILDTSGRIL